jgi:hypothetical protein
MHVFDRRRLGRRLAEAVDVAGPACSAAPSLGATSPGALSPEPETGCPPSPEPQTRQPQPAALQPGAAPGRPSPATSDGESQPVSEPQPGNPRRGVSARCRNSRPATSDRQPQLGVGAPDQQRSPRAPSAAYPAWQGPAPQTPRSLPVLFVSSGRAPPPSLPAPAIVASGRALGRAIWPTNAAFPSASRPPGRRSQLLGRRLSVSRKPKFFFGLALD